MIADIAGVEECIEKAFIVLTKEGSKIGETWSDAFGDFKIDDLDPGSGDYEIEISHPDHSSKTVSVALGDSIYIGTVKFRLSDKLYFEDL